MNQDNGSNNEIQQSNIDIIKSASENMLDYFNNLYLKGLEHIQELKTECFEVSIKLDELRKTRGIYAFKSNSRKNVFLPVDNNNVTVERNSIIDAQIADLEDVFKTLEDRIYVSDKELKSYKSKLKLLRSADDAVNRIMAEKAASAADDNTVDSLEFIEPPEDKPVSVHGYNILMQDAFDKTYLSTLIDRNIMETLNTTIHKMEMASYLLSSDVGKAKGVLQEAHESANYAADYVEDVIDKLNYNIDSSKPIWTLLDDFSICVRDEHPEVLIETHITCMDYQLNLHPVFTINLLRLVNSFFNNIFAHANANHVEFYLTIETNKIYGYISDNGIGIQNNYLAESPWYSSLHKANEIIFLLDGNLDITGSTSGTKVSFSFPIH